MSTSTPIVEINQVSFLQGDRLIFKNLNLRIQRNKITAIMGPSGTGKTTLLRLIGAQWQPSRGKILLDGEDIHRLNANALLAVRQNIGMLFQSAALFTNLTVYDNVAFPLRELTALSEELIHTIVLMKLEVVGLRGARDLMPSELSGGMARRVALARAVALDPQLMMYDEPFAGQDPISMGVLVKLIKLLNDNLNMTSIIVSHDVNETLQIADYVYILADGDIVGSGTPQEILQNETPAINQFIHGLADGTVPFHYPAVNLQEDLFNA